MNNRSAPALSEAQMEIMCIVWEFETCTVADVLCELQQRRKVSRNTVHTMMTRLVDKGWLNAHDGGGAFVYSAAVERKTAQQSCIEQMVSTVFDGSTEGLLLSLLQNRTLTREEATRIRRIIREAEERS